MDKQYWLVEDAKYIGFLILAGFVFTLFGVMMGAAINDGKRKPQKQVHEIGQHVVHKAIMGKKSR